MNPLTAGSQGTEITVSEGPQSPAYPGPFDIPVLIDDVKRLGSFNMTRFTFFTIEATTAVDDWVALLRERGIPFLLLGVSPVIHRPDLKATRFTSPEQIDQLLNAIEDIEGLVVETAYIWLPNFLFEIDGRWDPLPSVEDSTAKRGVVWRVSFRLFQKALQFQREVISAVRFSEQCRELMKSPVAPVTHSPDETVVFRTWSAAQLDAARSNYEQQREDLSRGVLPWLDEYGSVNPG